MQLISQKDAFYYFFLNKTNVIHCLLQNAIHFLLGTLKSMYEITRLQNQTLLLGKYIRNKNFH